MNVSEVLVKLRVMLHEAEVDTSTGDDAAAIETIMKISTLIGTLPRDCETCPNDRQSDDTPTEEELTKACRACVHFLGDTELVEECSSCVDKSNWETA